MFTMVAGLVWWMDYLVLVFRVVLCWLFCVLLVGFEMLVPVCLVWFMIWLIWLRFVGLLGCV